MRLFRITPAVFLVVGLGAPDRRDMFVVSVYSPGQAEGKFGAPGRPSTRRVETSTYADWRGDPTLRPAAPQPARALEHLGMPPRRGWGGVPGVMPEALV